jgi:hypothetical protein
MASFIHPRRDVVTCSEQDLTLLTDINRSLREQVITLLLEVAVLREQAQIDGVRVFRRQQGAERGRGN